MGSAMYGMYPPNWGAPGYGQGGHGYVPQRANMGSMYACTCGPYASVIPPEPCPIHEPEKAYWRRKLLKEFGGESTTVTTTSTTTPAPPGRPVAPGDIPKYESPVLKEVPVHYNTSKSLKEADTLICGLDATEDDIRWARVSAWVTCEACKKQIRMLK